MNMARMIFTTEQGPIILQWPTDISPEWLGFVAEALEIQMRAIRRHAEKLASAAASDAESEYKSWQVSAAIDAARKK